MLKSDGRSIWRALSYFLCCAGLAGGLSVALVAPSRAQTVSTSCAAVNSGAFNLAAALSPSSSSILTAWNIGDTVNLTLSSADGISRTDGLYHGPDFTAANFGALNTTAVPTTGSTNLSYTVTASDLTNGIAVDPENNDFVTATCTPEPVPTVTSVSPNIGSITGGTSVTITGMNFGGASAVTFGGTSVASFTIVSATSITTTTPAHAAGAVDVAVTTGAGTGTGSSAFTYTAAPTVTGVSPNRGSMAGGTVVSITGQNFTGATAVKFGTGIATSVTVNSATSITATSPAGSAATIDVTVTTTNGTSATSAADHFTYVSPPTVTSISPINGPPSGGTSITITGTNFTGVSAVKFGSATASFTFNSATQITANSPAASVGTVDVTVTTPGGTSATSAADQFTYGSFRTWVSAVSGNDGNPCTTALPCLTFAGALANTAPSGEIDVLTPGDYGPVTITTALSIYNDGVGAAGALTTSGTSGITINAGPSDAVDLRGLVFNGFSASGTSGVVFNSGAQLHIANCVFQGFATSGMTFSPGSGSAAIAEMVVQDSMILANGTGLLIKPADGISVHVTLNKIHIDQNTGGGLRADGTGGSGPVKVAVKDSSVSLNASNGINAVSGPGNVAVNVMRTVVASNGLVGIQSNQSKGGTAGVNVGYSEIYGNATGVASVGGGAVVSYPNNQVSGNTTNGSFTGTASLQ